MPKKKLSRKELEKARRTVRLIVAHHLDHDQSGKPASAKRVRIEHMAGGLTNLVFAVHDESGEFIVRLGSHPAKISTFVKEQWAIAKAREKGVPTPEVLQVGNEAADVPYMISRQSQGADATLHPERLRIVREMGHYCAVIHSIQTEGFGSTFEWSQNQLSRNATWGEYLHNELNVEERLETLKECRMLDSAQIRRLRTTLERVPGKDRVPALNHGDLRLKNVLVDDKGAISCVLDWEHCTSNLAPEWDLSIALHDLSIDERQEFLDGYGVTGEQISAMSPALKALTLINYAPAVKRAAKAKAGEKLEHYRVRLAGALDLYSL